MPSFRPVAPEEAVRHETVLDHAFGSDVGPPDYDGPEDLEDRIAERWGIYEEDRLRSACLLYDLEATLADGLTPIGGIGGFATPPEHRSNAYGTDLQRAALETFSERGYPYAILWPMSVPYYRNHGWGLAHLQTEYEFPPAAIEGVGADAPEGRFEEVGPSAYERLRSSYETFRDRHVLALDRSPRWWRERTLDDVWAYSFTPADTAEPTGYLLATMPGSASEMTLEVEEFVGTDEATRRALLGFVYRHHPQAEQVRLHCPEETRLLHDATDPKLVTATVEPGAMGRIVDVDAAIEALPASRNPPQSITIAVADSLRSANEGVYRIESGRDGPTVTRLSTDGDDPQSSATTPADGGSVDVTLDVGPLSRLYAGTVAVETVAERESIDVAAATLAGLDALFPPRAVYLPDFF